MIIGITGIMGSGKHTAAAYIAQKISAVLIDVDVLAHELYQPKMPLYYEIIKHFGSDITDGRDASISRKKLAECVFSDKKQLERLESLVHPVLRLEIKNRIEKVTTSNVVVVAALLGKMDIPCDDVLYITCPKEVIVQRVQQRDGLSKEHIMQRLGFQNISDQEADYVIDNQGDIQSLYQLLDECVADIVS